MENSKQSVDCTCVECLIFDSCGSRNGDMMPANTTPSTSKSSTLASIKSSFIAKVNYATVRRQRSAVDTCVSDVTSAPTDGLAGGVVAETAAGRRGSATTQGGVQRRRIRSPFSPSRLLSEPNKPSRSSLAEQRIIESVVFRPSVTSSSSSSSSSSSGRSIVQHHRDSVNGHPTKTGGGGGQRPASDIIDTSHDVVAERQGVTGVKRSLFQGQGHDQAGQMTSSSTLVRSVSTNNAREPLLLFVGGKTGELP